MHRNARSAINARFAVTVNHQHEEASVSTDYKPLTREELSNLAGEELPERAAMSLVNANVAIPVNAAVAANVLSDGATAYADALQQAEINQGN